MRWRTGRRSENLEDRRGESGFGGSPFGTRSPLGVGRTLGVGGGLGGLVLVVVLLLMGVDPSMLLTDMGPDSPGMGHVGVSPSEDSQFQRPTSGAEEELEDFVSVVLADTEDTWGDIFRKSGKGYAEPTLVLFSGLTRSACGLGEAAMGPFYCPSDQKVYIDLTFYDELRDQFGAPGDFAQAYVIAHEVGHHVQKLLGISDQVEATRRRLDKPDQNRLSVMQELQADCFAGIWAHHANRSRHILEQGDIEDGLNAAAAIGDDRLQRQSRGYVTPDSFTHGSSAQRVRWFKKGLTEGRLAACDTFAAGEL